MEVGDSSPQGIGFAHREDFHEECYGAFALGVYSFLVLIELLFCLSHKGEGKQTSLMTIVSHSSRKCAK
jgi:hypothetical protein